MYTLVHVHARRTRVLNINTGIVYFENLTTTNIFRE